MLKCNFDDSFTFGEAINAALDILGHVGKAAPVAFEFGGVEIVLRATVENVIPPRAFLADKGLTSITDDAICFQYFSRMKKSEEFRRVAEEHLKANLGSLGFEINRDKRETSVPLCVIDSGKMACQFLRTKSENGENSVQTCDEGPTSCKFRV